MRRILCRSSWPAANGRYWLLPIRKVSAERAPMDCFVPLLGPLALLPPFERLLLRIQPSRMFVVSFPIPRDDCETEKTLQGGCTPGHARSSPGFVYQSGTTR